MVDVEDPDDALSFSGIMFMPQQIAERVEKLLDKPEPVLAIPRWRMLRTTWGWFVVR